MARQEPEEFLELSSDTRGILEEHDLHPLWKIEDDMGYVSDDLGSDIWRWEDIQTAIDAIEKGVPITDLPSGFQRRIAVPINTVNAISNTIYVRIQTISPGEIAPSHRHRTNVLRLAINRHREMKTVVVDGEFPMKDNDLITTSQWEWHDHINDGDETATWLDILDLPFVPDSLDTKNASEYHELDCQPVTKAPGYWKSQYGHARDYGETKQGGIPGPFEGKCEMMPPYRFGWDDALEALHQRADNDTSDPHDGYGLSYVNPASGEPLPLPTMSLRAQLLQKKIDPRFYNMTEVCFIIEDEDATHAGGEALGWSQWGVSAVTLDEIHHHDPNGEAILPGMTDRPVFEVPGLCTEAAPQ